MSNTFDQPPFLESFIEEVNSYLPEIETNLERLAQSPGDMDALEETYRRTHTIGGSASMMDFPALAHVAHGMEDILGDALEGLTTLNEPTIGLLRRSLGRLHQLLEGIRNGVDEEAVIAEDDADFASYRAMLETPSSSVPSDGNRSAVGNNFVQGTPTSSYTSPLPVPENPAPVMPSFDEVLASFLTPSVTQGEEVAWPEEPMATPRYDESFVSQSTSIEMQTAFSALDALVESTRQTSSPLSPLAVPTQPAEYESVTYSSPQLSEENEYAQASVVPSWDTRSVVRDDSLPSVFGDMQEEVQTLEVQASSLKSIVAQLRSAMSIIEFQRSEFKGFLDGSKDALDRMEDWAGRAMGLNLRNSPEQVRRYLPLSVMWVANNKLKKVLDVLKQIVSGTEVTDEQMRAIFQQLQASLASCGDVLREMQMQSSHVLTQQQGWSEWDMQSSSNPEMMSERVTFERRGDPVALRAEIEAQVREELRWEYESRPVSLAVRAELEQQIRNEVRQEFEARRRLQESVAGLGYEEMVQEVEARLRGEIEIQVRQEFLNQIAQAGGDPSLAMQMSGTQAPASSNKTSFMDRAREAAAFVTKSLMPSSSPPTVPVTPPPVPSRVSAYSGDFGEEAVEIFRLEAEEHLQTISMNVAALEKAPTDRDIIQSIRRATHTLKGAAGMMGFRAIADLCHISEDLLDSIMEGTTAISSSVLSIILDTAETLDALITGRDADPASEEAKVRELQVRYAELLGEQLTSSRSVDEDIDVDVHDDHVHDASMVSGIVADEQTGETNAQRASRGDLSVRVRLQKLDELVNLFGEMLVNRSVLEERIQRLVRLVSDVAVSSNRLRDVGQKLESRFEAATLPSGRSVQVMPGEGNQGLLLPGGSNAIAGINAKNGKSLSELSHLSDFDELELDRYTEFHQLARGLSEGISDMTTLSGEMDTVIRECEGVFARESRLSATFQDRLMKVRLVPLSTMVPRLYRAARAVALKQHKDFELLLEGETTEVDRTVYEEIAGPLLHLMRNAVNHALETPEVRIQKGKSPTGQIKLSAAYEGNQVVITVRDDGIGIDPESVRNAAIARGLIRPDQQLGEGDLIDLIFRPGFSTAEVLSEESGRGVGLDVVRDSVARLRGTLAVESMPGQGMAFTMTFPTSLAIQNAMMVRMGTQQFAIPTVAVEAIGRLDNFKRTTLSGQPAVIVHNDPYPLHMLSQYLSLPVGALDEKAQLLIVNAGGYRVALVVDEIKGRFDIVMKNLGPHLRNVHGIAGGTVLGNGRVVLVLELVELLAMRSQLGAGVPVMAGRRDMAMKQLVDVSKQGTSPMRPASAAAAQPAERGRHILVVDDSPSVRRVVSNMLKQHNWEVQMARDGVEALEMISYETPAAVLLDIEMPRMDGYELISTVRAQEQYRTLPLVVLTSRAAAKHQQRAMLLGASAYVVKPYQDEELLNILNSLVYGTAVR